MCQRYFLNSDLSTLQRHFGARKEDEASRGATGHILPGQTVPIVLNDSGCAIRSMRWGFLHACAEDPKDGFKTTVIDAETVADKRDFNIPLRYRRCLVPADAFYMARKDSPDGGLARFRAKDGRPFAMAGIWNIWNPVGKPPVFTFAVLTAPAGAALSHVSRIPVLMDTARQAQWLSGLSDTDEIRLLLQGVYATGRSERPSNVVPMRMPEEQLAATGS